MKVLNSIMRVNDILVKINRSIDSKTHIMQKFSTFHDKKIKRKWTGSRVVAKDTYEQIAPNEVYYISEVFIKRDSAYISLLPEHIAQKCLPIGYMSYEDYNSKTMHIKLDKRSLRRTFLITRKILIIVDDTEGLVFIMS